MPIAFAIAAHPDDIEFRMAGTLALFKQAGWEIHYMNVANGCCGSTRYNAVTLKRMRAAEGRKAASILGAHFHPSLCNDMEILYDLKWVRRLAAIIREVKPSVVLTHPPIDYMEDHTNTCRLVVTATFAREMPNFTTVPARSPFAGEAVIYHCVPHGHCDQMRRPLKPDLFVNTASVHALKSIALAAHVSQRGWLETSQGLDSMQHSLDAASLEVGRMSRKFKHAEGWWRHLHYGFAEKDSDPLGVMLAKLIVARRPLTAG